MINSLRKHTLLLTFFVLFLLIGLPATLIAVNRSTDSRSNANAASTLRFSPPSTNSSPIKAVTGTTLPLEVYITPHSNIVSYVQLEINYDPTYFDAASTVFVLDGMSSLSLREGPFYDRGKVTVALDIGNNADNALRTDTKIGTLSLKPAAKTPRKNHTPVTFGAMTTILSIGAEDSTQENVLSSTSPAYISITTPPKGNKPQR